VSLPARATRWSRLALIFVGLLVIASAYPAPETATASDARPLLLTGHILSNLGGATRIADLPASKNLTLTIALRPASAGARDAAVQQALAARGSVAAVLSPDDVGRTFGQPQANIDLVAAHFRAAGFQVGQAQPDHLTFQVTGTVGQIEQLLAVKLGDYTDAVGHSFYATNVDPQLPANLAQYVQAVFGLDNYPAFQRQHRQASSTPGLYEPPDIRAAYNVTPLYDQGWTGTGQTIGVVGCDLFLPSDINAFRAQYGIPATNPTIVNVDGGPNGTDPETTLDLEWIGALATGASLRYYGFNSTGSGCPFQGFIDAVSQAVNDNQSGILSISLGTCETIYTMTPPGSNQTYLQAMENEFSAAVAEKIGVFVASGDSGAYACNSQANGGPPGVSYPASSPNVIAVGGTNLSLNSDSSYNSESAWGDPTEVECNGGCGSGGGVSTLFSEPPWQVLANIPVANGMRGVPDISLDADPATGYLIYYNQTSSFGCTGWCGGIGGTSVAAPEWAGLAAIANQAVGHRLGNLNPLLYGRFLWSTESAGSTPFHDVTTGNNLYYNAGTGWDAATGLGSPNAFAVVQGLLSSQCEGTMSSGATTPVALPFHIYLPFVPNC
jgi:subtilase family serine protease